MFDGSPKQVVIYTRSTGDAPYTEWLESLRDRQARVRIETRVARLRSGNPGDYKAVGEGVFELRIDYGPG